MIDNDRSEQHRINAAAKLPDHARGQKIIGQAAMNAREEAVRINAVKLLDDQALLADVAIQKDSVHQAIIQALSRMTDEVQFERVARETPHDTAREWALERITNAAIREEISQWYLSDPMSGAGYSVMKAALQYTDDQPTLERMIRRKKVNEDLKIKALKKVTDTDFLREILRSEDTCFQWTETLCMPGTSRSFKAQRDLKPYAEERLQALEKKA